MGQVDLSVGVWYSVHHIYYCDVEIYTYAAYTGPNVPEGCTIYHTSCQKGALFTILRTRRVHHLCCVSVIY